MKTSLLLRIPVPFCALATAALLAACGGGGGSTPNAVTRPQQAQISGRAVDGPLAGASACYDLNDNGQCDADELPRRPPPRMAASTSA